MATYQTSIVESAACSDTRNRPAYHGYARALINSIIATEVSLASNHIHLSHTEAQSVLEITSVLHLLKVTHTATLTITDTNTAWKLYMDGWIDSVSTFSVETCKAIFKAAPIGLEFFREVAICSDEILTKLYTWDEVHDISHVGDTAWNMSWVNPDFVGGNP